MPNQWFQFKQFRIQQDACAMKVTTDACVFGAWMAQEQRCQPLQVLDIGAGTGLLSLMLAQQWSQAMFTAVEIDEAAATQAAANMAASPFAHRLQLHCTDVRTWQPGHLFDVIISNPPFHEQQLASPAAGRSMAHHSTQLSLQQLLACATAWAHPGTQLYLLLPAYRYTEAEELALAQGWHTAQAIWLHPSDRKDAFRIMLQFCRRPVARQTQRCSIAAPDGSYLPPVLHWLHPYYLKL